MKELPGYLQPVYQRGKWLDLVFKSDLTHLQKLVAVIISQSCQYNRHHKLMLSNISNYSVSRVIRMNSTEAATVILELVELGWLFDTGIHYGARNVYALTFSLIPLGDIRQ